MLSNSGVNINDSIQVKNHLNIYYNAQFSYFAYQQVISNCATFAGSYVLPRKGTEADFVESAYRYGFNGQEKDDEIAGVGNVIVYEARILDSRLGRWMSVDLLAFKQTSWTPFHFSYNNPLYYIDIDGNIPYPVPLKYVKDKTFVWGRQSGVSNNNQEYGKRTTGKQHYGIDFNVGSGSNDLGIPILNLADGVVLESGTASNGGNYIIIKHGNGYVTRFFHMKDKPTLKAGDVVNEGDEVGQIGGTFGYPVHGHLEIAKLSKEKMDKSDAEILREFKTYDHHIDPRDIIGKGQQEDGGDLQIHSSKKVPQNGLYYPKNQTTLKPAEEKSWLKEFGDWFLGRNEFYDDSFFDTMDRYERSKLQRK